MNNNPHRGGRLHPRQHHQHQWRISQIAGDFELVDAWELPASGSWEEFDDLCAIFAALDPEGGSRSMGSRVLFGVRERLGEYFGWDDEVNSLPIPDSDEVSLRERLPEDLPAETDETVGRLPFRPVYRTDDEWALELSNSTVHAVLHLGWAPRGEDRFQGQLGVFVKPRGWLGRPYMTAIAPFRHYLVYPALLRAIGRKWQARRPRQAVVAVIHDGDRFLWIERGPGARKPGFWAPPSGSVEPGESSSEALAREMAEELGITIKPVRQIWQCPTENGQFLLDWWLCELEDGEPHPASDEVADVRWVTAAEIHDLSPTFPAHIEFIDEVWPAVEGAPEATIDPHRPPDLESSHD